MIKRKNTEKRKYPRIEHRLPLKVAVNGYDFVTSTENVSCLGTYCRVAKYIPPFTKIMVKLSLNKGDSGCNVECKGVVVRTEDEQSGGFNIAIYFNHINDSQRQKISQYISQFLP